MSSPSYDGLPAESREFVDRLRAEHDETIEHLKEEFTRYRLMERKKIIEAVKRKMLTKMKEREDLLRKKLGMENEIRAQELKRLMAGQEQGPDVAELERTFQTQMREETERLKEHYRKETMIKLEQQRKALQQHYSDRLPAAQAVTLDLTEESKELLVDLVQEEVSTERQELYRLMLDYKERMDNWAGQREQDLMNFMLDWALKLEEQYLARIEAVRESVAGIAQDGGLVEDLAQAAEEVGKWVAETMDQQLRAAVDKEMA